MRLLMFVSHGMNTLIAIVPITFTMISSPTWGSGLKRMTDPLPPSTVAFTWLTTWQAVLSLTFPSLSQTMSLWQRLRKNFSPFNGENFFLCKLPIDKCRGLWYNGGGDQRAALGSADPNSRSVPTYGIFHMHPAALHMRPVFPQIPQPPAGGRSVRNPI